MASPVLKLVIVRGSHSPSISPLPFPSLPLPPLVSPLSPPDPIPVLKQGVMHHQKLMQAQDYEIENKQLRETLQEYNSEFAQVESTITVVYTSCLQLSLLRVSWLPQMLDCTLGFSLIPRLSCVELG